MTEGEQSHEIHEYLYRGYIVEVACAEKKKKRGERRRRERIERSANAETTTYHEWNRRRRNAIVYHFAYEDGKRQYCSWIDIT